MAEGGEAKIPLFGARGKAKELADEVADLRTKLEKNGSLALAEVEARKAALEVRIVEETAAFDAEFAGLRENLEQLCQDVVVTEEAAVLQEVGVYE
jgi:predicted  nucleic acid-binding Zn-ribbon protein